MDLVKTLTGYVLARLSEASTWTSIGLAIIALPGVHDHLAAIIPYIVPALAGLGAAIPEGKKA